VRIKRPQRPNNIFGNITILDSSLRVEIFIIFFEFILDVGTKNTFPLHAKKLRLDLPMRSCGGKCHFDG